MPLVMDTRPAAYCVIVRDSRILLTHFSTVTQEGKTISGWTLPGGGMEIGEQPADTAQREVYEETGYTIQIQDLIGVHAGYFDRQNGSVFCALRTVFRAEVTAGELTVEEDGSTTDARWVPLKDIDSYIQPGFAATQTTDNSGLKEEPTRSPSPHFLSAVIGLMGFTSARQWAETEEGKTL